MRTRMSSADSRAAALAAARALLVEDGAAAVTLKAVAQRIGRTHANLLHHFGSVAGLHAAMAEDIARTVSAAITAAIGRRGSEGGEGGEGSQQRTGHLHSLRRRVVVGVRS